MDQWLSTAKMLLNNTDSTFVLCDDSLILTDKRRGIRPLLDLLDGGINTAGFAVADKVVGKAAAYLYCLLRIKSLYAAVISQPALAVLQNTNISVEYDQLVPSIRNRVNDGPCPMESAVWNVDTPKDALVAIRSALIRLDK